MLCNFVVFCEKSYKVLISIFNCRSCETADGGKMIQINGSKFVDTNCGFLLDPADIAEDEG